MLLGFALVLLSMFFFYVARRGRTLVAGRIIAAFSSRSLLCFTHGPPITRLHRSGRDAAQLARPRRDPPGVDRGPLVASLFLQSERTNPALQIRKNSAATSHPPIACGSMRRTRTFPPPMRRHAACSGSVAFTHALRGQASRRRPPGDLCAPLSGRFVKLAVAPPAPRSPVSGCPNLSRKLTPLSRYTTCPVSAHPR
jgi:hypothetical protein